ncbi:hypothetical protein OHC33_008391 [Knufia fluminis]|uniref:F-box domain-containing protein n=1 Tax=Knufia fluminis TaxID=191047 RepID=A0AAN8EAU9_9EURO|nr:hypothetical protein OHC33_008391 [Knufia fluminis]
MPHINDLPPEILLLIFYALHNICPLDFLVQRIPDVCILWHNLIINEKFEVKKERRWQGDTASVHDWVFSGHRKSFQWPWEQAYWQPVNYRLIIHMTAEQAAAMREVICETRKAKEEKGGDFTDQDLAECRCRWCRKVLQPV